MENQELNQKFQNFLNEIDIEKIESVWTNQSKQFRDFWKEKIMNAENTELTDSEIDEIVLILDKNAKGSTPETLAVAKAMIPQGVWRRLFSDIKQNRELRETIFSLLNESDEKKQIDLINSIYKINEGKKNSLTGRNGNALNSMLFAYNSNKFISVISLNHRKQIIHSLDIDLDLDFEKASPGERIIKSNFVILNWFKNQGWDYIPYIPCLFFYKKLKDYWSGDFDTEDESEDEPIKNDSQASFYMEKELENFLVKNWDKTEFAEKYELIEEDGQLVSQQYCTDIGIIDILVKDKKSSQYVVIELKKEKTSDKSIGQLSRYMGWLETHKSNGNTVKGIIIASAYDKKLYYALKKIKDVEVYTYQIDFTLKEFKQE